MKNLLLCFFIVMSGVMTATTIKNNVAGPTAVATTIIDESCSSGNGSLTIGTVSGGGAPYTYDFNGLGYSGITSYPNLVAGTYILNVKDSNGDIYTTTVTLSNLPPPATPTISSVTQPTCSVPTGTIVFTAQAGVEYSINGATYQGPTTFSGLNPGTYSFSVRRYGNSACFTNGSGTVTINAVPSPPSPPTIASVTQPTCAQPWGTIVFNTQAGVQYSINGVTHQASPTFSGVTPGTYTVNVRSVLDNTCISDATSTVTIIAATDCNIDSDGDGVVDGMENSDGTNPNNSCSLILSSQTFPTSGAWNAADCDSDGIPNGTEFTYGTNPLNSDTDGDGVTDGTEVTDGTYPNNTCSFVLASQTLPPSGAWNVGDCDGDGLADGTEVTYGTDPLDPDTDRDGVTDGTEDVDGTNPLDDCSFVVIHQTLPTTPAWQMGDCDGDGIPNGSETDDAIKLNAFIDSNANGIQDVGEVNYNYGEFHYELNNDGTIHNVSSSYGYKYIFETNPTNSYDVNFSTNSAYHTVSPSSYSNITVATGSGITTYNFPITAIPYTDLRASIYQSGVGPRPGFTYINRIDIQNIGNQTTPAGTLIFTNDNRVTITNVSPSATMTATGFTYNYPSLAPDQSVLLYVTMQVPTIPTIQLGNLITNTVSVAIPAGDIDTSNNNASLTQEVRGSYDPNDKNESHGPQIVNSTFTSTDYLNYTIQFENTGTANAVTVKVDDVLDAKLDETSIKMIDASHNYVLDRVGNDLTWTFIGIDLPPSVAGTSIGKGYINFQVKPKAGYAIGDIINNTAYIYFDFNPAIVTNTFATEFVTTLDVSGFVNSQFSAYPNPTTGIITIVLKNSSGNIDTITVTDVLGKTVLSNSVHSANTTVDISHLTKGLYFVKIQAEGQVKTLKVVKE